MFLTSGRRIFSRRGPPGGVTTARGWVTTGSGDRLDTAGDSPPRGDGVRGTTGSGSSSSSRSRALTTRGSPGKTPLEHAIDLGGAARRSQFVVIKGREHPERIRVVLLQLHHLLQGHQRGIVLAGLQRRVREPHVSRSHAGIENRRLLVHAERLLVTLAAVKKAGERRVRAGLVEAKIHRFEQDLLLPLHIPGPFRAPRRLHAQVERLPDTPGRRGIARLGHQAIPRLFRLGRSFHDLGLRLPGRNRNRLHRRRLAPLLFPLPQPGQRVLRLVRFRPRRRRIQVTRQVGGSLGLVSQVGQVQHPEIVKRRRVFRLLLQRLHQEEDRLFRFADGGLNQREGRQDPGRLRVARQRGEQNTAGVLRLSRLQVDAAQEFKRASVFDVHLRDLLKQGPRPHKVAGFVIKRRQVVNRLRQTRRQATAALERLDRARDPAKSPGGDADVVVGERVFFARGALGDGFLEHGQRAHVLAPFDFPDGGPVLPLPRLARATEEKHGCRHNNRNQRKKCLRHSESLERLPLPISGSRVHADTHTFRCRGPSNSQK